MTILGTPELHTSFRFILTPELSMSHGKRLRVCFCIQKHLRVPNFRSAQSDVAARFTSKAFAACSQPFFKFSVAFSFILVGVTRCLNPYVVPNIARDVLPM